MRYEVRPDVDWDEAPASASVRVAAHTVLPAGDAEAIVIPHGRPTWLRLETDALELVRAVDGLTAGELRSLPFFGDLEPLLGRLYAAGLLLVGDRTGVHVAPTGPGADGEEEPPRSLLLKLTGACDMACRYCYDYADERWRGRLDMDLAKRLIDECLRPGRLLTLMLHGGEPFLQFRRIKEIVAFATEAARERDARVQFCVQTNGLHFTDEVVAFLGEHPFGVGVSLDGPAHVHDRERVDHRGRGTFDRIAESFERHPEFMRERVGYISVATPENVGDLPETWRFFRDLGVLTWKILPADPQGRGEGLEESEAFRAAFIGFLAERLAAIRAGDGGPPYLMNLTQLIAPFVSLARPNMCMKMPCGASNDLLVVDAVGAVRGCDCSYDPAFLLTRPGRAPGPQESIVAAARATPQAAALRERTEWLTTEAPCASCEWLHFCSGTCPARALMRSGTLFAVDELECRERLSLFPGILEDVSSPGSALRAYHHGMTTSVRRPVDPYELAA